MLIYYVIYWLYKNNRSNIYSMNIVIYTHWHIGSSVSHNPFSSHVTLWYRNVSGKYVIGSQDRITWVKWVTSSEDFERKGAEGITGQRISEINNINKQNKPMQGNINIWVSSNPSRWSDVSLTLGWDPSVKVLRQNDGYRLFVEVIHAYHYWMQLVNSLIRVVSVDR